MTEMLLRVCSAALIAKFLYGATIGTPVIDEAVLSAVFAAWADILKGQRQ
jgi:hypothetical protein